MTSRFRTILALSTLLPLAIPSARADEIALGTPTQVRLNKSEGLSRTFAVPMKQGERIFVKATAVGHPAFSGEFLGTDGKSPLPDGNAKGSDLEQGWTSPPAPAEGIHSFRVSASSDAEIHLTISGAAPEKPRGIAGNDANAQLLAEIQKVQRNSEQMAAANAQLLAEVRRLQARVSTLETRAAEVVRLQGELQMLRSKLTIMETGMIQLRTQIQMKR